MSHRIGATGYGTDSSTGHSKIHKEKEKWNTVPTVNIAKSNSRKESLNEKSIYWVVNIFLNMTITTKFINYSKMSSKRWFIFMHIMR